MSIVYFGSKEGFPHGRRVKQLYYAVQRVLQRRGGVTAELLAQRMASRKGMSSGDGECIDRFAEVYRGSADGGESVTIGGWVPSMWR